MRPAAFGVLRRPERAAHMTTGGTRGRAHTVVIVKEQSRLKHVARKRDPFPNASNTRSQIGERVSRECD